MLETVISRHIKVRNSFANNYDARRFWRASLKDKQCDLDVTDMIIDAAFGIRQLKKKKKRNNSRSYHIAVSCYGTINPFSSETENERKKKWTVTVVRSRRRAVVTKKIPDMSSALEIDTAVLIRFSGNLKCSSFLSFCNILRVVSIFVDKSFFTLRRSKFAWLRTGRRYELGKSRFVLFFFRQKKKPSLPKENR